MKPRYTFCCSIIRIIPSSVLNIILAIAIIFLSACTPVAVPVSGTTTQTVMPGIPGNAMITPTSIQRSITPTEMPNIQFAPIESYYQIDVRVSTEDLTQGEYFIYRNVSGAVDQLFRSDYFYIKETLEETGALLTIQSQNMLNSESFLFFEKRLLVNDGNLIWIDMESGNIKPQGLFIGIQRYSGAECRILDIPIADANIVKLWCNLPIGVQESSMKNQLILLNYSLSKKRITDIRYIPEKYHIAQPINNDIILLEIDDLATEGKKYCIYAFQSNTYSCLDGSFSILNVSKDGNWALLEIHKTDDLTATIIPAKPSSYWFYVVPLGCLQKEPMVFSGDCALRAIGIPWTDLGINQIRFAKIIEGTKVFIVGMNGIQGVEETAVWCFDWESGESREILRKKKYFYQAVWNDTAKGFFLSTDFQDDPVVFVYADGRTADLPITGAWYINSFNIPKG